MKLDAHRLPSWLTVIAGVWLVLAPFVVGHAAFAPARANVVGVGLLVVALAIGRAIGHTGAWASWVTVVLGVWLTFSPYMLRYGDLSPVATHDTLLGLVITALALWSAFALPMNEVGGVEVFASTHPDEEELAQRERPRQHQD